MDIKGHTVHRVWVERSSDIEREYYFSITFDRGAKRPLLMLTTAGGVDIEEVAATTPERLARLHLDPLVGFQPFHARRLCFDAGFPARRCARRATSWRPPTGPSSRPTRCWSRSTRSSSRPDGELQALDSKYTVDDNALFRHPDIAEMRDLAALPPEERMARERGVTYVKLDGYVGILGNGAGLVMSTLDVVAGAGGEPANFLDVGGGAQADEIVTAMEVLLSDPNVRAVLFNVFGGITRCDEVARGHPDGARPARRQGADGRAPRRDERRRGPPSSWPTPRRPTCTSRRPCSGRRERVVELAGSAA